MPKAKSKDAELVTMKVRKSTLKMIKTEAAEMGVPMYEILELAFPKDTQKK